MLSWNSPDEQDLVFNFEAECQLPAASAACWAAEVVRGAAHLPTAFRDAYLFSSLPGGCCSYGFVICPRLGYECWCAIWGRRGDVGMTLFICVGSVSEKIDKHSVKNKLVLMFSCWYWVQIRKNMPWDLMQQNSVYYKVGVWIQETCTSNS